MDAWLEVLVGVSGIYVSQSQAETTAGKNEEREEERKGGEGRGGKEKEMKGKEGKEGRRGREGIGEVRQWLQLHGNWLPWRQLMFGPAGWALT